MSQLLFVCACYAKKMQNTSFTSNKQPLGNPNFGFMVFLLYSVRHEIILDRDFFELSKTKESYIIRSQGKHTHTDI